VKIVVVGGGPAGLYLALLLRRADLSHRVTVLERNPADATYGWGVVFSDQTLGNLRAADPESYTRITERFAHWDDIDVHLRGTTITSGGHGFSGIARVELLRILQERAAELGVEMRFGIEIGDDRDLAALGLGDAELVVAADGINSRIRTRYADHFEPEVDLRSARYTWLGTTRLFDAFTFAFVENEHGVFQAHAYRFDGRHSAFIVECDEASWRAAGFDRMANDEAIRRCEAMFAPWLDGHPLISNAAHLPSIWLRFARVATRRWHHMEADVAPTVLIGDAAHTAHFSIGSGTKLALEDAISLAGSLAELQIASPQWQEDGTDRPGAPRSALGNALHTYQEERRTEALRLQNAARNSMEWFENVRRYIHLPPEQFAYSLLTRSQRVSHENLRLRDAAYLSGVERWFASVAERQAGKSEEERGRRNGGNDEDPRTSVADPKSSDDQGATSVDEVRADGGGSIPQSASRAPHSPPPMFTPFRLRGMTVVNRVVVAPMDMYCAEDGVPNPFHLVHLGSRALGGAGLLFTEMTCVSPDARITLGCTGMYTPEHAERWTEIVAFVHRWSHARICVQLGHSGRKGATRLMWEGMDEPLEEGGWEVLGPSPLPYGPRNQVPRTMTRDDMDRVREQFVRATEMAAGCGFDMLELHAAHGYLLSSFLTPLSNRREDEFGGSLENRLRFPLEVLRAMRAAWPEERPMGVRISATDWVDGGVDGAEAVAIARAFHEAGADIIHVSAGQTTPEAKPVYGRMFQTPFSDRIRNEAGIPTIAVGNITEADQINAIIAAGRADLCALARPHLSDPHWTLHAAAELGYAEQPWPVQYLAGKKQLERLAQRRREAEQLELLGTSAP
jgi:anthraniloyl-CoA monooxygenase